VGTGSAAKLAHFLYKSYTTAMNQSRQLGAPVPHLTVYFDGLCPLCRREIAHYRRLDRAGALRLVDLHAAGPELEAIGVRPRDALRRLHVLDRTGRLHTGVSAFAAIWSELPGYRWPARMVQALRLEPVLELGYRAVTRWRLRGRCAGGACG
jgi:predicted DCC family thiol-disulfide oxidoreductase YuxK